MRLKVLVHMVDHQGIWSDLKNIAGDCKLSWLKRRPQRTKQTKASSSLTRIVLLQSKEYTRFRFYRKTHNSVNQEGNRVCLKAKANR